MFAKCILRRTGTELTILKGGTVSEGETKVGNYSERFFAVVEIVNRICGNSNGTAIDDIQPE